jgi:predicted nucleotidyltransferase
LDVVDILREENVDYAIIGAFALSIHGDVRATTDVDALVCITVKRLAQLRTRFARVGFTCDLRRGDVEDPIPALLVLTDGHANQVDLLAGLRGLDAQFLARTIEVPFLGEPLRFVGREDLIAMKCFAGGPQDLIDAQSAYNSTQSPLNMDLLRMLARGFGRVAADNLETVVAASRALDWHQGYDYKSERSRD